MLRWPMLLCLAAALLGICGCSSTASVTNESVASTSSATTTTTQPATTEPPAFASSVGTVTAADVASSWREGCPVGPDALRRVTLSHWGFDGQAHTGTLVVNASVAEPVVGVFRTLFDQHIPIRLMQPVDAYGGSDDDSMAADNTSGFNCRNAVSNGPPHWSQHAYGLAIDINPLENPEVLGGRVLPPEGAAYLDRGEVRPGMVVDHDPLVSAFAAAGWGWGGGWTDPDYQHFSANGR